MPKPKRTATDTKETKSPQRARLSPDQIENLKAAQAHQSRMMRLAIPAIAPLVLLAVLSATRLMDRSQSGQVDYWAAGAVVGLTPVVIALLLTGKRSLRRVGYALLILIDLGVVAVGLAYGSKSGWFYGAAGLFALATSYGIWAVLQDKGTIETAAARPD
ncbi:MAG TPA: hypothetical protein VL860_11535 [Planctomycetota bacterium]|nr:hypothetical protein [Planctomycetota bacterium]